MAEQDLYQREAPDADSQSAGARLRRARETLGLSRADIAARTKIAERHLAAIEEERFADLASSTYAVGFSRAYARAVGMDEREIAQTVRDELDLTDETDAPDKQTFEPGDPARVPSSRTAWLAGLGVVGVVIGIAFYWSSYYAPSAALPDLLNDAPATAAASTAIAPPAQTVPVSGPVVFTAMQAGVWIKVTDETGKQLFQKELALGESYVVPADAVGPLLRTAWPDALSLTIGGRPMPPLSDKRAVMTVPVSAAALLSRATPKPVAAPAAATPATRPSAAALPSPSPAAAPAATAPSRAATPPVAEPAAAAPSPPAPAATPVAAPAPAAEAPKASTVSQ